MSIKLTQYSHGAGCGCKLSPGVLQEVLGDKMPELFPGLLVGNESKDDAAVFQLDDETGIISTTDFFMPIVDDPFEFGGIAAANAISDIYAMGGTPLMAIAILGWPINKLSPKIAGIVLDGARATCKSAGIPLAGGHSIDSPEPIFGLAVTGKIPISGIKQNTGARVGDVLYLTKPLGVGLVTTAQKRGEAKPEDLRRVIESMLQLNVLGKSLASLDYVHAVTDVTGFGLAGHLIELMEGSNCSAKLNHELVPRFDFVDQYIKAGTVPGGTQRNWDSYGHKVHLQSGVDFRLFADPQTSGGLLISVDSASQSEFEEHTQKQGLPVKPFGSVENPGRHVLTI